MAKPKAKPRKSKTTGAKKGGKPGNQNARKHGLWAKNQPRAAQSPKEKAEQSRIEERRDLLDEVIERLAARFQTLDDIDQICKCANSISLAVTAANGCDRTLALVSGKVAPISLALDQLYADEDPYDPATLE